MLLASRMVASAAGSCFNDKTLPLSQLVTKIRSHGFVVGHVVPEAQVGGPIALVKNGDIIHIDAEANTINLDISSTELEDRRKAWIPRPLKVTQGTLFKYAKVVEDASHGCVTDAGGESLHQST